MKLIDIEIVVIGAGVIGLSIARSLLLKKRNVVILEKENQVFLGNSSRNSGVIHAGIYYHPSSLKAKLCVLGKQKIYKYLKNNKINYSKCGKLIVASSNRQINLLHKLKNNASRNGVDTKLIDANQTSLLEPNVKCCGALLSHSTGIVNQNEFALSLQKDIESLGGSIALKSELTSADFKEDHIEFVLNEDVNQKYKANIVINAAGIWSRKISKKIKGLDKSLIPNIKLIKGNYYKLIKQKPFNKLIYPIPNKYGLGIHSTINLDNETIFGPDTEIIKKINFKVTPNLEEKFLRSISTYTDCVKIENLHADYCGVREKTINDDFVITKTKKKHACIINLFGIDSPGLTASLAIGEHVVNMINST